MCTLHTPIIHIYIKIHRNPAFPSHTTAIMDILPQDSGLSEQLLQSSLGRVSSSFNISTSPQGFYHSPSPSKGGASSVSHCMRVAAKAKQLKPFATEDIKILLLENVNQTGRDVLAKQGYQVEFLKTSIPEDELIRKIRCGSSPSSLTVRDHSLTNYVEMFTSLAYGQKPCSPREFYGRPRISS